MLSIDFETLARKFPELQDAWRGLEEWVKSNPAASVIDTRRVTREIRMEPFNPAVLASALNQLKEQANFKQVYRVFNPSNNQFLQGEWDRYGDVPEKLPDAFDNFIDVSNLRVIPVLKQSKAK
jgi:hypothetical protein